MIDNVRQFAVPAIIGISFFLFGFFTTADLLELSLREIMVGLAAGAVGGLTTLAVVLHQTRGAPTSVTAA